MPLSRRSFLAASTAFFVPRLARAGDKLRLGVIGVGNRGKDNLDAVAHEHIAALCDVDARFLAAARTRFPDAKAYTDFRALLAQPGLDAVVISTPDHTHAPAAAQALRAGLHVYCEKPLTHSVHEARVLRQLAQQHGAVTQMGTQIHALPTYRHVVELVRSGAIGEVREVHVFFNGRTWDARGKPKEAPAPNYLDFALWLGPAPEQPHREGFHPMDWRRYWDFGGGTFADMGCHFTDLAFWALELQSPDKVQAFGPAPDADAAPNGMHVEYAFPARGTLPPVRLTWYDGSHRPEILTALGLADWKAGVLFVGSDGRHVIADYTRHQLGPKAAFADFKPPAPFLPESAGHHQEWLDAIRTRARTSCPFSYSGRLTEAVLLGNVSFRLGGKQLVWDAMAGRVKENPAAEPLLRRPYRDGWSL
jgi:predicted dehydrogenase